ncbi:MAG TPA: methyl-accepting chemotaxis protein [Acetobacteraceae bacterium]|jgi:methyl-accepting chemotaxis protein
MLARLRIRIKLVLLLALSGIAVVTLVALAATQLRDRMVSDRIEKLRTGVQMASGFADMLAKREAAGQLTHEAAVAQLRAAVHAMHFDNGTGYVVFQLPEGIVLAHGGIPALEGRKPIGTDIHGHTTTQLALDALRNADAGVIYYAQQSSGMRAPQSKLSYVARFAPWNAIAFAAAPMDDLQRALHAALLRLSLAGGLILLLTLAAAWCINHDIGASLGAVTGAVDRLANGDLTVNAPGADRQDEIGSLARGLLVFQKNARDMREMAAAQDAMKLKAAADQKATLNRMADNFEREVGHLVARLATDATGWHDAAQTMATAASAADQQAAAVTSAAVEASGGVQSAATAAEELTASIEEIARLVTHAADISSKAIEDARRTDAIVKALDEGAQKIGHIVGIITSIASQTNLLALNATIEAARAGDAGKGFAVVASEVKNLASQTSRATEEIGAQITQIQAATAEAVGAIRGITATIDELGSNAATIASAVREQGSASSEISQNVQQTAKATQDVTDNISGVSQSARQTGTAAAEVLRAAGELAQKSEQLTSQVNLFVSGVRAA